MNRYSFNKGDVIINEKVMPRGIPASRKLRNIGIDEQEQKGVRAPNRAAAKCPIILGLLSIHWRILCCGI